MKKIVAFVNPHSGPAPGDGSEAPERVLSDPGCTAVIMSFEEGDVKAPRQLPLSTARGWQSRTNRAQAPDPGQPLRYGHLLRPSKPVHAHPGRTTG